MRVHVVHVMQLDVVGIGNDNFFDAGSGGQLQRHLFKHREGNLAAAAGDFHLVAPLEAAEVPTAASGDAAGVWSVWDVGTRAQRLSGSVPGGALVDLRFTPQSETLLSQHEDDSVRTWRVSDGAAGPVLVAAAGQVADRVDPISTTLVRLDPRNGAPAAPAAGHRAQVTALRFSPDSARLAWSPDGTQLVWDERFTGYIHLLDVATGRDRLLQDGVSARAGAIDWDRP